MGIILVARVGQLLGRLVACLKTVDFVTERDRVLVDHIATAFEAMEDCRYQKRSKKSSPRSLVFHR